jgi:hypothetical protein
MGLRRPFHELVACAFRKNLSMDMPASGIVAAPRFFSANK